MAYTYRQIAEQMDVAPGLDRPCWCRPCGILVRTALQKVVRPLTPRGSGWNRCQAMCPTAENVPYVQSVVGTLCITSEDPAPSS